jgi:hypothetical protein
VGWADPCLDAPEFVAPPAPDPDAGASPTLLSGEWISAGVLELRFSKALAPGALDPRRFSLMSWRVDADNDGDVCTLDTDYSTLGRSYYQNALADVWIGPGDGDLLLVRMSNTAAACPAAGVASGLMLAYTNGDTGGGKLLDANGDALGDIGPAWAVLELDECLENDASYCVLRSFGRTLLTHLASLAPIPCPNEF